MSGLSSRRVRWGAIVYLWMVLVVAAFPALAAYRAWQLVALFGDIVVHVPQYAPVWRWQRVCLIASGVVPVLCFGFALSRLLRRPLAQNIPRAIPPFWIGLLGSLLFEAIGRYGFAGGSFRQYWGATAFVHGELIAAGVFVTYFFRKVARAAHSQADSSALGRVFE